MDGSNVGNPFFWIPCLEVDCLSLLDDGLEREQEGVVVEAGVGENPESSDLAWQLKAELGRRNLGIVVSELAGKSQVEQNGPQTNFPEVCL